MQSIVQFVKMISNFYYKAVLLICSINYGYSVPIDYCLHPLDKSDCKGKPTPVFSYYKPGSRCEIEIWRGCPTFNKFNNEFLCSHYCIGKLLSWSDEEESVMMLKDEGERNDENDITNECHQPISDSDCGVKGQFKYTYIEGLCIRFEWKGCSSSNLFDTEEACRKTCHPQSDFAETLEELPIEDVKAINDILDNALDNRTQMPIQQLMLKVTTTEEEPKATISTTEAAITSEEPTNVTLTTDAEVTTAAEIATEAITEATTEAATEAATEPATEAATEATTETTTEATTSEPTTEASTKRSTAYTRETTTAKVDNDGSAEEVITT